MSKCICRWDCPVHGHLYREPPKRGYALSDYNIYRRFLKDGNCARTASEKEITPSQARDAIRRFVLKRRPDIREKAIKKAIENGYGPNLYVTYIASVAAPFIPDALLATMKEIQARGTPQ